MTTTPEALIERFDHLRNSGVCSPTTRGLLDDAEALITALSTPPAAPEGNFDVREAVFDVLDQHHPVSEDYCSCGAGYGPTHLAAALFGDRREFGVFDVPSFEVRPRGTVTDASDVNSRLRAALAGYLDLRTVARVMADLEAAREDRNAAHCS